MNDEISFDYAQAIGAIERLTKERDQLKAQLEYLEEVAGHKPIYSWPLSQTIKDLKDEHDQEQAELKTLQAWLHENKIGPATDRDVLIKQRDEAQAACAEMRQALAYFPAVIHADAAAGQNVDCWNIGISLATKALSTTCGKGYVSVEQLKPTIEIIARRIRFALVEEVEWENELTRLKALVSLKLLT